MAALNTITRSLSDLASTTATQLVRAAGSVRWDRSLAPGSRPWDDLIDRIFAPYVTARAGPQRME